MRAERERSAGARYAGQMITLALVVVAAVLGGGIGSDGALTPGPSPEGRGETSPKPKVLLIGVDGVRVEAFWAADVPNMKGLVEAGCWTDEASTDQHTISGAGWSNILTGVWSEKHCSPDNGFKRVRYDQYPHFFARLREKRPEIRLGHFVSWPPIDQYILNQNAVEWRFSADNEKENGDIRATIEAEKCLREGDPDVVFYYQGDVDTAGHKTGFSRYSPEYMAELADTDANIGRVLAAMKGRKSFADEDWLVILTCDHGGTLDKSHGRNDPVHRTIMFMAAGSRTAHGKLWRAVSQVDVAATVFDHLGITPEAAWDWDGRPCVGPVKVKLGENLLENAGGEWASGADDERTNLSIPCWRDWESMTVVNYERGPGVSVPRSGAAVQSTDPRSAGQWHGRGYFCGGTQQRNEISQVVDVAALAADVDGGKLAVEIGGWFGGVGERTDLAYLEAAFVDEHGGVLGTLRAGAVTLAERREAFGTRAEGSGGGMNLGCADEVWCVVRGR